MSVALVLFLVGGVLTAASWYWAACSGPSSSRRWRVVAALIGIGVLAVISGVVMLLPNPFVAG